MVVTGPRAGPPGITTVTSTSPVGTPGISRRNRSRPLVEGDRRRPVVAVPAGDRRAALAGATPDEIIADYLLTYDRMKHRYDELGIRDQRTAVRELLAKHGTTVETSLTSTITSLAMPGFLLENGLSDAELAALRTRLEH